MRETGVPGDRALQQRMQNGVRRWVLRVAMASGVGLREASPAALLSLLCAAAFGPLVAAAVGLTGGVAAAGIGVASSVGSGVLGDAIADVIDRMASKTEKETTQEDLEREIALQIEKLLAANDERAGHLRSDIAVLLKEIDVGKTAMCAAVESGNEKVHGEIVASFGELGAGFTEMRFLLADFAAAAAEIQESLNEQDAKLRALIHLNGMQLTEVRLTREAVAAMEIRRVAIGSDASTFRPAQGRYLTRDCPYRGLLPYRETDAEIFYGRERVTSELVGRLASHVSRGGPIVVTGASGVGKSSLLLAGLLPALSRGLQLPGSQYWRRMVITPTRDPLSELATCLAVVGGADAAGIRAGLVCDPSRAHLAVRQAVVAGSARRAVGRSAQDGEEDRLLLVVDQFEQIFTLNAGPDGEPDRRAFISALCAAATHPAGPDCRPPALVVIAVRGDFWDQCAAYPDLADALQHGQFIVGPMNESDLRLAFTGPADAAGLRIDPSLMTVLMADLRAAEGDPTVGVLPLLSQAMLLTWENREGDRLTSHGYGQAGGLIRAVQTSADSTFDAMSALQQGIAREVLRSMVVVGREGRIARRPVARADLYYVVPNIEKSQVDAVLEAFAAKRLIVLDRDTAQIAHDALPAAWPRLRGWLEEDRAASILHGQLADDSAAWISQNKDSSFLYRGTQLAAVRQAAIGWSADPDSHTALTTSERRFLLASEIAAARGRRQRRVLAVALVLLLIASVAGAGIAVSSAHTANRQRDLAVSNQLAAQSESLDGTDPVAASLLAAAASRFADTAAAHDSLLDAMAQPERAVLNTGPDSVRVVAFSPDGKSLAVGAGTTVELWDVATHRLVRRLGHIGSQVSKVSDLAFSPVGTMLAAVSANGTARLWNLATHRAVGKPLRTGSSTYALGFNASDRPVLSIFKRGTIRSWAIASHREVGAAMPVGDVRVLSMALSPDATKLALATSDGTQLWDIAAQTRLILPTRDGNSAPDEAVFSRSGNILATVSGLGTDLWDVNTAQR